MKEQSFWDLLALLSPYLTTRPFKEVKPGSQNGIIKASTLQYMYTSGLPSD
jgi:hypothetical protein